MCNCSASDPHGGPHAPVAAGFTMKPLAPLATVVTIAGEGEAEDQPPVPGPVPMALPGPIPSLTPCRLDFRQGCYQINYRPTGSLVTFEGTLRVDRSAPDGGPDKLIVSGDLYTRLPVIKPVPAVPVVSREGGEPVSAPPLSVAGSLSAAEFASRSAADPTPVDPDLRSRPLSLVSQGDERLVASAARQC